ncbi:HTH-type transcriptional repressor YcgE [Legionella hackeliae]|uniref:MerR family transcriptional regulator n=1 Tax=Legionella hackeliae TaxID=449 RepID=UPI000E1B0C91|nr:MerR family transcriptional regulator [Legionella hackeliae]STX47674.1 HTH-type transcriptional repressor YcgE [Legionella hackeliae]
MDFNINYFPISYISAETGVNPVTLRAWERRYGLIHPKRTVKGHRLYSHDDVILIKQILFFNG